MPNIDIARAIFTSDLYKTHSFVLAHPEITTTRYLDAQIWVVPPRLLEQSAWLATLWMRINWPDNLVKIREKQQGCVDQIFAKRVEVFKNAHLSALVKIKDMTLFADTEIRDVLLREYGDGCGNSMFIQDHDISVERSTTEIITRESPLQILRRLAPEIQWTIEERTNSFSFSSSFEEDGWEPIQGGPCFRIYGAIVGILNDCYRVRDREELRWAAIQYRAAFLDLLFNRLGIDISDISLLTSLDKQRKERGVAPNSIPEYGEEATPLELFYPWPHRGFTSYDLPQCYYLLYEIPLKGVPPEMEFMIGKIMQKSLPFCCQSRNIIGWFVCFIQSGSAAWRFVKNIFFVMLAGLYDGDMMPKTWVTTRQQIRAMEIVSSKKEFIRIIQMQHTEGKKNDIGCQLIVYTALRLYYIYMARDNPHIIEYARQCLPWDAIVQETMAMYEVILASDTLPDDAFYGARSELARHIKNSKSIISRYNSHTLARKLAYLIAEKYQKVVLVARPEAPKDLEEMRDIVSKKDRERLLKTPIYRRFLKDKTLSLDQLLEQALHIATSIEQAVAPRISNEIKSRILNLVIRVPPTKRLSRKLLDVLILEEYGGLSIHAAKVIAGLVEIYNRHPFPKQFRLQVGLFEARDLELLCWFYHLVARLEDISFIRLPASMILGADKAMRQIRYTLHQSMQLPPHAYNVLLTICCFRLCTLTGTYSKGNRRVSYCYESESFVCAKKIPREKEANSTTKINNKRVVHAQRIAFTAIPCSRQPVLQIPLRGLALVLKNRNKGFTRYLFCPRCASLHEYSIEGYANSRNGEYRCTECIEKERVLEKRILCSYCGKQCKSKEKDIRYVNVWDVKHIKNGYICERMPLCSSHYTGAKRKLRYLSKEKLWNALSESDSLKAHRQIILNKKY